MKLINKWYKRLDDDEWVDEIRLVWQNMALVKAITVPRYKTSGLSGDEWRVSARWLLCQGSASDFDRLGNGITSLETATKALYPTIFGHKYLHDDKIETVDFYRKGVKLYESSYEKQSLNLIHVAGHLPWAWVIALEESQGVNFDNKAYCFQPGCDNKAVSLYKLMFEYDRTGRNKTVAKDTYRCFCERHLRRGDCGLEDADRNYIVISGPGPDRATGWEKDESPSVFGGIIG